MKKFLFVLSIATQFILPSFAQYGTGLATYKVSNPNILLTGSFTQPATYGGGTDFSNIIFPWYTPTDSVTNHRNSLVDSFTAKIQGPHENVYTWCHITTETGTVQSILGLYATADSASGTDWLLLQTYTVSATAANPVGNYTFTGWPYTSLKWKLTGGTGDSIWWYSGINVR